MRHEAMGREGMLVWKHIDMGYGSTWVEAHYGYSKSMSWALKIENFQL
jgi:hypothetical protein